MKVAVHAPLHHRKGVICIGNLMCTFSESAIRRHTTVPQMNSAEGGSRAEEERRDSESEGEEVDEERRDKEREERRRARQEYDMPVGTVIDWGEWGNKGTTKV